MSLLLRVVAFETVTHEVDSSLSFPPFTEEVRGRYIRFAGAELTDAAASGLREIGRYQGADHDNDHDPRNDGAEEQVVAGRTVGLRGIRNLDGSWPPGRVFGARYGDVSHMASSRPRGAIAWRAFEFVMSGWDARVFSDALLALNISEGQTEVIHLAAQAASEL